MRRGAGHSAAELIVVLAIAGVAMSIAVPRALLVLDRISVVTAKRDVMAVLEDARALSLAAHHAVAVDIPAGTGVLRVRRDRSIVRTRDIATLYEVQVTASRDSMSYDARGLGHGAANLSIVLRRRAAAETVFVSRLGRVR